jgi:hypothetical protein
MGKGKGAAYRASVSKAKAEMALVQVAQMADKMCTNPTAAHDFAFLKQQLDVLYTNANLIGAPKDVRESFISIFKTTSQIVDLALKETAAAAAEPSILDRKPRY